MLGVRTMLRHKLMQERSSLLSVLRRTPARPVTQPNKTQSSKESVFAAEGTFTWGHWAPWVRKEPRLLRSWMHRLHVQSLRLSVVLAT